MVSVYTHPNNAQTWYDCDYTYDMMYLLLKIDPRLEQCDPTLVQMDKCKLNVTIMSLLS